LAFLAQLLADPRILRLVEQELTAAGVLPMARISIKRQYGSNSRSGTLCLDHLIHRLTHQRRDTAVVFDEGDMRRPATDRFEPERACARVTVKNMRSRNPRREDVE